MNKNLIEDILPYIERPSRYLGNEINVVKKDIDRVKLKFALAFPDLYDIGTSHFGIQILYNILNKKHDVAAERFFAPAPDMADRLRSQNMALSSMESGFPMNRFDIIGFSLLYELNYTNILYMLELGHIPVASRDRDIDSALVIAGGPCTFNPEPVAPVFDAIVVGDGELVVGQIAETWMRWRENGGRDKDRLLYMLEDIEGVYVPGFYNIFYVENSNGDRFQQTVRHDKDPATVRRAFIADLDTASFPTRPIVPYGKPVHDRLRIEVARGCTQGCRFCQAGMIYRPVRERSLNTVINLCNSAAATTGYEDLSLLSLSTGDYSAIDGLLQSILSPFSKKRIAVSLPSLRAETLTPEVMQRIKQMRKTGFTIAPEAGSQRLRDVINKKLTQDDIYRVVENAFELGWQVIKLYFMIGLPTETDEDIQALIDMVKGLQKLRKKARRKASLNISVGTFIPKGHTPFQWVGQMPLSRSRQTIEHLKRALRLAGVQFKWQNPEVSLVEGLFARGDRRLFDLLRHAVSLGCRFDGWTDYFRFDLWKQAFESTGLDTDFFVTRKRHFDECLPWDVIDSGVSKSYLISEYEKALSGEITDDCRNHECNGCGVCDFDTVFPRVHPPVLSVDQNEQPGDDPGQKTICEYRKMTLYFSKTARARFFGHLELVNIFIRALRRSDLNIGYTQGYHPKPRLSFGDTLPVGMESEKESVVIYVSPDSDASIVAERIDRQLPEGLRIVGFAPSAPVNKEKSGNLKAYSIRTDENCFDDGILERFDRSTHWYIETTNRKGRTSNLDLKAMIVKIQRVSKSHLKMVIKPDQNRIIRPGDVLIHMFNFSENDIKGVYIRKISPEDISMDVQE